MAELDNRYVPQQMMDKAEDEQWLAGRSAFAERLGGVVCAATLSLAMIVSGCGGPAVAPDSRPSYQGDPAPSGVIDLKVVAGELEQAAQGEINSAHHPNER